jgi:hypothetical protein
MSDATTSPAELTASESPVLILDSAVVAPPVVVRNHEAILRLTAEIFPAGEIAVTEEIDPEIPGPEYFVVNVRTSGEIRELVAKDGQWHHRIWDVAPETASSYRLSLGVE